MTELLLRLFVRDYKNTSSPSVHSAIGKLAGVTGIVCNILLFLGKLAAGILSGSVSIIADAVNNLSDASSSLVTLLGFRMAQQPADRDHPYGHARYEYLSGLVIAALILLIGADLAKSSAEKILHPEDVAFSARHLRHTSLFHCCKNMDGSFLCLSRQTDPFHHTARHICGQQK